MASQTCREPTAFYHGYIFDVICREHDIAHKFAKPYQPSMNGQPERMNRTIKGTTVQRYQPRHLVLWRILTPRLKGRLTTMPIVRGICPNARGEAMVS
jgi:hypothetical protein